MNRLFSILRLAPAGVLHAARSAGRACGVILRSGARACCALPRIFWRLLRNSFRVLRPAVFTLLFLAVAADIYLETTGLPPRLRQSVLLRLAERGITADVESIHAGLVQGIVLDGVTVYDAGDRTRPMFRARTIRITPQMGKLFSGRLLPRTVAPSDLEIYPPPFLRDELAEGGRLETPVARLGGTLSFHRDMVDVKSVTGDIAGIRVQFDGRLSGLPALDEPPKTVEPFGWQRLVVLIGTERLESLRPRLESARRDILWPGDGRIEAQFDLPLKDVKSGSITGSAYLADSTFRDVDIRNIRLHFDLRGNRLRISRARVHIIGDQSLSLDGTADFKEKSVECSVRGSLNPEVAARLLAFRMPSWLADAKFGEPLKFQVSGRGADDYFRTVTAKAECRTGSFHAGSFSVGTLEAGLEWETGKAARISVQSANLAVRGVPVQKADCTVSLPDLKSPRLDNLDLVLDAATGERIGGSAAVSDRDGKRWLAADLAGSLHPGTLLRLIPGAPQWAETLTSKLRFTAEAPSFSCHLEFPETDPLKDGSGRLELKTGAGMLYDLHLKSGVAKAEFSAQTVTVGQELVLGAEGGEAVSASAVIDLEKRRIRGRASGKLYADRLFAGLHLPTLGVFDLLRQNGAPAGFTAELADSPLAPVEWSGSGSITTADTSYEDLDFVSGNGSVAFGKGFLSFTGIRARTKAGDDVAADITILYPQAGVRLRNVTVDGDPRLARVFVPPGVSRNSYDAVFKDFTWDPLKRPHTQVEAMAFAALNNEWQFTLAGRIAAENASWRGLRADRIGADVKLNLPSGVSVENVKIIIGGRATDGEVRLSWSGAPSCQFRLKSAGDPLPLLCGINPDWKRQVESFTLDPGAEITCEGGMFLGSDPRPRLRGTIRSPVFRHGSLQIDELAAKWSLEGSRVWCSPVTALFYGGRAAGSGHYDFHSETGQLALSASGVSLAKLLEATGTKKIEKLGAGLLSGSFRLEMAAAVADAPLQLNGTGNLRILEANLEAVPVVSQLAAMTGSSFGRISRLDASLVFDGDRVVATDFHTNGSILSLKGDGDYNRTTRQLDFRVRGEMFKATYLKYVFRPLAWFFDAELTGTPSTSRWRMVRGLSSRDDGLEEVPPFVRPPTPQTIP